MPYPPESLAAATAIGIAPKAPFNLRTEPSALVFGRHLSAKVRVIAERQKGFDGEIALAVAPIEKSPKPNTPPKSPLPAGVTVALKPIPKAASSVELTFSADNKASLDDFTAVLTGTLKGKENQPQPTPGVALKLEPAFRLEVAALSPKLPRKGTAKLKVIVRRNPAFHGEIMLTCSPLPKGVSQASAKLNDGVTEKEIVLAATDAPAGTIKNAKVKGRAKVGNERFTAEVPFPPLAIE